MYGISVFPGMGIEIDENLDYIKMASIRGAKYIFTSLHIPEAEYGLVEDEFIKILEQGKMSNMKVIVDTSKEYFNRFNWGKYKNIILRLDFGFSDEEIVEISRLYSIQLNASTIDCENMENLIKLGIQTSNLSISHNYYPRIETGISLELLRKRNDYFKSLKIEVMAFVASSNIKRGPLYEGLPTVEDHRDINILVAAQELLIEGCDIVLIGDSIGSIKELDSLCKLEEVRDIDKNTILLPVSTYQMSGCERVIFEGTHRERMDSSDYVVRSSESRLVKKQNNLSIIKKNTIDREMGSITIDNSEYQRYEGELQICKRDLKSDERVNVVGKVEDEGRLVSRILSRSKFVFYKL